MEYEKVHVPKHDQNWCQRCDQYHCVDCVDYHKVEFSITESIVYEGANIETLYKNWKNQYVCPLCYNQLVEKHKISNKEVQ